MIKIIDRVSDETLETIIMKHEHLIDLDVASVRCGHCNNLKYKSFLAFVSKDYQGINVDINAMPNVGETYARITYTSINAGIIKGFTTTVKYKASGVVLFNINKKEVYILTPEQEVDFISMFKQHRGIEFYQSAIKLGNDYITIADIEDYMGIQKYL